MRLPYLCYTCTCDISFIRSIAVVSHLVYILYISDTYGYCILVMLKHYMEQINTEIDLLYYDILLFDRVIQHDILNGKTNSFPLQYTCPMSWFIIYSRFMNHDDYSFFIILYRSVRMRKSLKTYQRIWPTTRCKWMQRMLPTSKPF